MEYAEGQGNGKEFLNVDEIFVANFGEDDSENNAGHYEESDYTGKIGTCVVVYGCPPEGKLENKAIDDKREKVYSQ